MHRVFCAYFVSFEGDGVMRGFKSNETGGENKSLEWSSRTIAVGYEKVCVVSNLIL